MKKQILIIFILIFSMFIVSILIYGFFITSVIPLNKDFNLEVKNGDTLSSVIKTLKKHGLMGNDFIIKIYTRIFFPDLVIKVGSYRVSKYTTYWSLMKDLNKGIGFLKKIIIPPGLKLSEIASLFESNNVMTEEDFYMVIRKDSFLAQWDFFHDKNLINYWENFKTQIPLENRLEGFLYPETYFVSENTKPKEILKISVDYFFSILSKIPLIDKLSIEEIYKKIIIASLIEEEAVVDSEKPIIASVIYNRLNKGMRLELCPTVEYILPEHKKKLTEDDLKVPSIYNTYLHKGLPPTPICNPSFNSLKAAFFPAKTDYLFYVAKGDGTHYFSKTFTEHLKYKSKSTYY